MKMLSYLQKLDKNQKKKEYYDKLYKEQNKIVRKQFGSLCYKRQGPPLKDYYAQKPYSIKQNMKKETKKKEKTNYGVAFITVATNQEANMLISNIKDLKRDLKVQCRELYERFEVYVSMSLV